jgi:hypothetical protein
MSRFVVFGTKKKTEAEIVKAAKISFHRIIAEGTIPTRPISPNRSLIVAFSLFLGFLFSIIFIYSIHSLKHRVSTQYVIEKNSCTPLLKSVPYFCNSNAEYFFFKNWMLELDIKQYLNEGSIITFSSYNNDEGKTYLSTNVLKTLESIHKKVFLIIPSQHNGLKTIEAWEALIRTYKQQFDILLIDNYSIHACAEAIIPMHLSTLNLFLLDSRRTKQNLLSAADLLKENLSIAGFNFILNRADYSPSLYTEIAGGIKKIWKVFSK